MGPALLPELLTAVPGPASVREVEELALYECPAITARRSRRKEETGVPQDPIVWKRAEGANVWDVDGNRYVDLTSAFAVMGVGHRHPRVVAALERQASELLHGMGDVFPTEPKIALMRRLAEVAPGELRQSILAQSGASAVEAALKTAVMATGRSGVIAFHGSYHGLSPGALAVTAYKGSFREPFKAQLNGQVVHVPYPGSDGGPFDGTDAGATASLDYLDYLLRSPATGVEGIGALIVEPVQGRGGEVTPPSWWLQGVREVCTRHGVVMIADEIYTGFGRTGRWFACERSGVVPDILCVGKGMGGGFPISAAIGTPEVMGAWGSSRGESIHTSTFLGNPLGCAMALGAIEALVEDGLVTRAATLGAYLRGKLEGLRRRHPERVGPIRGLGMMLGLPLIGRGGHPDGAAALEVMAAMLGRGFIILPSGVVGHVLAFSPPFVIERAQLDAAVDALDAVLS